jgi:hypothetical protein
MLALTMSLLAYYLNYRPLSGVSRRKSFLIANRMAIPGATALAGRLRLREVRDRWRTLQIGDAAAGAEVLLLPPRDVRHSRHGRAPDQDPTPHVVLGGVLGCDPDAWRRRAGDAEQARHGALRDRVSTPVQAASR